MINVGNALYFIQNNELNKYNSNIPQVKKQNGKFPHQQDRNVVCLFIHKMALDHLKNKKALREKHLKAEGWNYISI